MINFTQKAQELSHALVRIAVYVRRRELRERLESLSFDLVELIHKRDYEQAVLTIDSLSGFLKLGAALYEVETLNSRIILGELSLLNAHIRQLFGLDKIPDASVLFSASGDGGVGQVANASADERDMDNDFANYELANTKLSEINNAAIGIRQSAMPMRDSEQFGNGVEELGNSANSDSAMNNPAIDSNPDVAVGASQSRVFDKPDIGTVIIGSTIRQNAILDKIKAMSEKDSSGYMTGCRMKDLMATFPEVSERTLRYDLQKLLGRGVVERMGNGGPSSGYVIK